MNIAPHALITLYSLDSFMGVSFTIPNYGNKSLKVTGFANEYSYTVRSLKIECSCKINSIPSNVVYQVNKATFNRLAQIEISYTFYDVLTTPPTYVTDPPNPFNPTILIIPDFGTDIAIYEYFQERLAYYRFSSIILNLRGVGMSYSSTDVQYAEIIQDYRFIAKQLNQYVKKPIVIGHGIGGAIAQLWSLIYKFELNNLILIGTAPYAVYTTYNLLNTEIQNWISGDITTATFATDVANVTYNTPSEECQVEKLKLDLSDSILNANKPTLELLFTQNPDIPSLALAPKLY